MVGGNIRGTGSGAPARSSCDAGSACVATSCVFFALQTATIKLIDVPPILLLQVRSIVLWALLLVATLAMRRLGVHDTPLGHSLLGLPGERKWLFVRSLVYVTSILLYWTALECLPAGDCTAITQSFLWTNFLSRAILKEPLRAVVWPCALLHMSGIILVARPQFLFPPDSEYAGDIAHAQQRTEGVIAAVAAALCFGALPILTRLARHSHWLAIEHTNTAFSAFVAAPLLLAVFVLVEPMETHLRAHSCAPRTTQHQRFLCPHDTRAHSRVCVMCV